jgi:hypothetical protein
MEHSNTLEQNMEQLLKKDYPFKFGEYINEGFTIFKKNIGYFIGFMLVYGIALFFINLIPILGQIASGVIAFPLWAGVYFVGKKILKDEPYEFKDFFIAFTDFNKFLNLWLVSLVSGFFIAIGIFLLVIPGIYLAIAYALSVMFVLFAGTDFWNGMEFSRKLITKKWFHFFGFFIVLGLINLLGAIALGIGLLVTIPATSLAVLAAYDDIVGVYTEEPTKTEYSSTSAQL